MAISQVNLGQPGEHLGQPVEPGQLPHLRITSENNPCHVFQ